MIDFISVSGTGIFNDSVINNPNLSFIVKMNDRTGELHSKDNKLLRTATYKDLTINLYADQHTRETNLYLKGSVHKFHYGGVNYTDFSFDALRKAVNSLETEIGIGADKLKLLSFEFGVNIQLPISCKEFLENLISYNGEPPNRETFRGAGLMLVFKKSNHWLKVYDKGLQYNKNSYQLPFTDNLLRYEVKIKRLDYLKKKGIKVNTLADLISDDTLQKLQLILIDTFGNLVYYDSEIEPAEIKKPKDRLFLIESNNPRYWHTLRKSKKDKQYRRNLDRFTRLVSQYSGRNIKENVRKLIRDKLDHLSKTVRKLPNLNESDMSDYYPYISGNNPTIDRYYCKVTGIDITHQKGVKNYVSENTVRNMFKYAPEVFVSLLREFGPTTQSDNVYKDVAHNIRNRYTNRYHLLKRRVIRSLSDTSLFDGHEVLTLTPEQLRILSDYRGLRLRNQ